MQELPTLYRLCNLTGVLLDEDVRHLKDADISKLAIIATQDRPQFQWARRTLHRYTYIHIYMIHAYIHTYIHVHRYIIYNKVKPHYSGPLKSIFRTLIVVLNAAFAC